MVFSAAESVAYPGAELFGVLVEEQPAIANIRAAASVNRVWFFKATLPVNLGNDQAVLFATRFEWQALQYVRQKVVREILRLCRGRTYDLLGCILPRVESVTKFR